MQRGKRRKEDHTSITCFSCLLFVKCPSISMQNSYSRTTCIILNLSSEHCRNTCSGRDEEYPHSKSVGNLVHFSVHRHPHICWFLFGQSILMCKITQVCKTNTVWSKVIHCVQFQYVNIILHKTHLSLSRFKTWLVITQMAARFSDCRRYLWIICLSQLSQLHSYN